MLGQIFKTHGWGRYRGDKGNSMSTARWVAGATSMWQGIGDQSTNNRKGDGTISKLRRSGANNGVDAAHIQPAALSG
jgi:hypothetical protein